jgi:hypothetical protein
MLQVEPPSAYTMTRFVRSTRAYEGKLPCAHRAHVGIDENFPRLGHARQQGRKDESSARRKVHLRLSEREGLELSLGHSHRPHAFGRNDLLSDTRSQDDCCRQGVGVPRQRQPRSGP